MLNRIDWMQGGLVRAESYVLLVCVLAMLSLAAYNVFYRNVLVPFQDQLREVRAAPAATDSRDDGSKTVEPKTEESEEDGSASGESSGSDPGGFGGGFGSDEGAEQGEGAEEEEGGDDGDSDFRGGFGGGEGGDDGEEPSDEESGEGFGGGFGGGESEDEAESGESDSEPDAEAQKADAATAEEDEEAEGKPVWWASAGVRVIAWLKLSWVDTFLRHMVLVVGFLGGMIAARRREHITIDAVGRLLQGRAYHVGAGVVTLFATVACGALAVAGADLVAVSLEYPEEVMPGIQLWVVQLVFPIGFGLMGVHFLLRALENAIRIYRDEPIDEALPDADSGGESEAEEASS